MRIGIGAAIGEQQARSFAFSIFATQIINGKSKRILRITLEPIIIHLYLPNRKLSILDPNEKDRHYKIFFAGFVKWIDEKGRVKRGNPIYLAIFY